MPESTEVLPQAFHEIDIIIMNDAAFYDSRNILQPVNCKL